MKMLSSWLAGKGANAHQVQHEQAAGHIEGADVVEVQAQLPALAGWLRGGAGGRRGQRVPDITETQQQHLQARQELTGSERHGFAQLRLDTNRQTTPCAAHVRNDAAVAGGSALEAAAAAAEGGGDAWGVIHTQKAAPDALLVRGQGLGWDVANCKMLNTAAN